MTQTLSQLQIQNFQNTVYQYYHKHGRDFPWRKKTNTPYHILVSEIMLQQTQADRVVKKYKHFLTLFPNFKSLASSNLKTVLTAWQGLGYNRRAINIHKCAQVVHKQYHGKLPQNLELLQTLPGIGPYTAAAILAFAFNQPTIVIETNIRTVYIHHFFTNKNDIHDNELRPLIEQTLDRTKPKEWYAALMDYGAYLKKSIGNKSTQSKHYTQQSRFEGSNREARGKIINALTKQSYTLPGLVKITQLPKTKILTALKQLQKEQIVTQKRKRYMIHTEH